MRAIIDPFVQLCLFRIGPQNLPCSPVLLGIVVAAYSLLGAIALVMRGFSVPAAVFGGLLDSVIVGAATASLLVTMQHRERLLQTLTALLGTAALISVLALPIQLSFQSAAERDADTSLPELLSLVVLCWFIAATANILRHALGIHFGIALIISFMLFLLVEMVLMQILGAFAPVPLA